MKLLWISQTLLFIELQNSRSGSKYCNMDLEMLHSSNRNIKAVLGSRTTPNSPSHRKIAIIKRCLWMAPNNFFMCGTMTAAQLTFAVYYTVCPLVGPATVFGEGICLIRSYIYGSFFLVAPQPLICIHKCIHNVFAVTAISFGPVHFQDTYILGYVQGLLPSQLCAFPLLVKQLNT